MDSLFKRIILGCFVLLFLGIRAQSNDLTDDYFDIAQNYYKEGDKVKALEYIEQILKIEDNNLNAIGLKIKLTPPTKNKQLPKLEKPLIFDVPYQNTGNPTADAYYQQGLECYKNKNYPMAEESLQTAIKMNPNNYFAYNTLGLVYFAQNKLDKAIEAFEKSNETNKNFTIPLDNLAQIYKQLGESEKCFDTLTRAQTQNPKDFCAYMLLGDFHRDIRDFDNAIMHYQEVIKLNPKYNLAYLKIAKARTDNMDFNGSNNTLNYYNKLNPQDDTVFYLMAKNYEYMNIPNKAKEAIYRAILMNNCREYRIELGKINYQNDYIEDALEDFTCSITDNSSSELYNYIGMCHFNLHNFNKAISNINKAISMPDKRVLYYYNLAKIYYTLKDNENYNQYMGIVKSYKPETCQDYIDLSGIMLDSEGKNSAINMLNKGIKKYPKVKELYLEKMKIYDLTDDNDGLAKTKGEMESIFK